MPKKPLSTAFAALSLTLAALGVAACHAPASSAPQTYTERSTVTTERQPYDQGDRRDSRRHNAQQASDTPGTFDFYLLTLSWSPEFCYSHPNAAECATHPAFVLHGLWPQNTDDSYPEHCSDSAGPANPAQYSDIFPDSGLLAHEWQTHGTCSGLTPDAYFQRARRAYRSVHIPPQLASVSSQIQLSPDAILTSFAQANPSIPTADMALSCGNNFLTAVEVCLDKNLQATSCSSVRTCRANVVKVTPPGASRELTYSPSMIRFTECARPVPPSQPISVAHIFGLPFAASNLPGIPVKNRFSTSSVSTPITESYGPLIPTSVWYAVPPGNTRSSAVGMCVCVPSTAVTRPSRYQPSATFSLEASPCTSSRITFASLFRRTLSSSSSALRNGSSQLLMNTRPCRFITA